MKFNLKLTKQTLKENQLLILGFRTEDIFINETSGMKAKIFNIKSLGKEQTLIVKINDETEMAITTSNANDFQLYQDIFVAFNEKRYHLFDAKTEERIN